MLPKGCKDGEKVKYKVDLSEQACVQGSPINEKVPLFELPITLV